MHSDPFNVRAQIKIAEKNIAECAPVGRAPS
jgi:hypothetical protein